MNITVKNVLRDYGMNDFYGLSREERLKAYDPPRIFLPH